MRIVTLVLVVLLLVLQYQLWFGQGSYLSAWKLRQQLESQAVSNVTLQGNNNALQAEVDDLKQGHQAVEEEARADLGMVRQGETFYQIVPKQQSQQDQNQNPDQNNQN